MTTFKNSAALMFVVGLILSMCLVNAPMCFGGDKTAPVPERRVLDCTRERSAFNPSSLVQRARVKGTGKTRLYLYPEHPALCTAADDGKCKTVSYVISKDRLAVGNVCGDWAYVQFRGKNSLSRGWVTKSGLELGSTERLEAIDDNAPTVDNPGVHPAFALVKGKGTPVCDAYLERLNTEEFDYEPYCGRPENDSVPGFAWLNRVPLSAESVYELFPRVEGFVRMQQQFDSYPGWTLDKARTSLRGAMIVWGYESLVDIDNDGAPDRVIVWSGFGEQWGLSNDSAYEDCAIHGGRRTSQLAFIVNSEKNIVDEAKTNAVFWRAKPGVSIFTVDHKVFSKAVPLPIGRHIDIFKYRNLFYFDTFYENDGWGDVDGNRKRQSSLEKRLAVFLHQGGRTQQICEYGVAAADFQASVANQTVQQNSDGTFSFVLPSGETSVAFSLTNTSDVGSNGTLQLSASLSDPANPTGTPVVSNSLTQNFVEGSLDPFVVPQTATLFANGDASGGLITYTDDNTPPGPGAPPPGFPATVGDGPAEIFAVHGNEVIAGGSGSDTIDANFGLFTSSSGVDQIIGSGGQDVILNFSGGIVNTGLSDVQIFANQAEDISSAIQNAQTDAQKSSPGDLIVNQYNSNATIVGSNDNDLIADSSGDALVIAGSGNDTIVGGLGAYSNPPPGSLPVIEDNEHAFLANGWSVTSATPGGVTVSTPQDRISNPILSEEEMPRQSAGTLTRLHFV